MNFLKNNVCSLIFLSSTGLIEAKPEVLRKIYPYRKDMPFYVLQFCIYTNFLSVKSLGAMNFLKNNGTFFSLHENRDGHLAGLM